MPRTLTREAWWDRGSAWRSELRGGGRMVWAGRSNCDLPESLPFPGTVMLQGSCRASMSVAGPLPPSVSQQQRRLYLEQLGWAGPAGRRAGEESSRDGEPARAGGSEPGPGRRRGRGQRPAPAPSRELRLRGANGSAALDPQSSKSPGGVDSGWWWWGGGLHSREENP